MLFFIADLFFQINFLGVLFFFSFFLLLFHSVYFFLHKHYVFNFPCLESSDLRVLFSWRNRMWWEGLKQQDGRSPITASQPRHPWHRDVVTALYHRALRHRHVCIRLCLFVWNRQRNVVDATPWLHNLLRVSSQEEISSTRRTPLYTTPVRTLARYRGQMAPLTTSIRSWQRRAHAKWERAIARSPSLS